jgi:Icc-related predicted phosphoesterase
MEPFEWLVRPAADTLVIAGDMLPIKGHDEGRFDKFIGYLNDNWKTVIWVPGNHDYYGMVYGEREFDEMADVIHDTNIHIANNHTIVIKDVNFVCTTLWTHIPPQYEPAIKQYLHDFRVIGKFNPLHYNKLNADAVKYLRKAVDWIDGLNEKIVVVTHHLPTWGVVSYPYRNDDCTYGFANTELDDLLTDHDIAAWIHGHSHDAREDDICGTLVARNPVGYPQQRGDTGYDPVKVINV